MKVSLVLRGRGEGFNGPSRFPQCHRHASQYGDQRYAKNGFADMTAFAFVFRAALLVTHKFILHRTAHVVG